MLASGLVGCAGLIDCLEVLLAVLAEDRIIVLGGWCPATTATASHQGLQRGGCGLVEALIVMGSKTTIDAGAGGSGGSGTTDDRTTQAVRPFTSMLSSRVPHRSLMAGCTVVTLIRPVNALVFGFISITLIYKFDPPSPGEQLCTGGRNPFWTFQAALFLDPFTVLFP